MNATPRSPTRASSLTASLVTETSSLLSRTFGARNLSIGACHVGQAYQVKRIDTDLAVAFGWFRSGSRTTDPLMDLLSAGHVGPEADASLHVGEWDLRESRGRVPRSSRGCRPVHGLSEWFSPCVLRAGGRVIIHRSRSIVLPPRSLDFDVQGMQMGAPCKWKGGERVSHESIPRAKRPSGVSSTVVVIARAGTRVPRCGDEQEGAG